MKKIFAIIITMIMIMPTITIAKYRSDSDTGVEILDYIENRRREERDKQLTPEQQKLLEDIEVAKQKLPNPEKEVNEESKFIPAVFEGDDMSYDAVTGEFEARGKVEVIQIDGHKFQTDEATGNVKEQTINIPGKAHVLQYVPNSPTTPKITLDGYRTVYNYGTKVGTMGAARGKAGEYYIGGKRFEFYPDHVVIYNATQTKCGAKRPDYHLSADKMEIWETEQGKVMKMYKIKFFIGENVIGTKKYLERKVGQSSENDFPKVGYNKDYGLYVEQDLEHEFNKYLKGIIRGHVETKKGVRSNTELRYVNKDFTTRLVYGYFDDDDNIWIQKEPSLMLNYKRPIKNLPLNYSLDYEIGHWRSEETASRHQKYEAGLTHDPILIGSYVLNLHTSYSITKESANHSTVKGVNYDTVIGREFDRRFAAFAGYHYRKSTSQNSVFRFDNDDYQREFETGCSYVLDNKNRVVVGLKFDTEEGALRDVDYYWYHDLHCSQIILRYREKRDKIEAKWQFTPW